ncbi:ABC transporter permease [Mesoterricola silvestris]|uniref:ABC transporter permease n=1 Tax=Mesoterricola silvestris TaxID=2927979 RepID=A0AA48GSX7_9BACT|nr:ABC transporter permease [Mesoterricola silvestris]BDU73427.1 hypothetical protein METEAL_26010 [Mesoterricola silvestris]
MPSFACPTFLADLSRSFSRRPVSSLVAVLMLAMGIGASTAVFSLMAPVLLGSSGLTGKVVEVSRRTEGNQGEVRFSFENGLSLEEMQVQQAGNPAIAALAQGSQERFVVRGEGAEARYLRASFITSAYFQVMGVAPWLGRGFTPQEDRLAEPQAILSFGLWHSLFGGDRKALGRVLQVNGHSCRVAGVLPRGFSGHLVGQRMDLWLPLGARAALAEAPEAGTLTSSDPTLARLRPGFTLAQAEQAFRTLGAGFQGPAPLPGTRVGPLTLAPFAANRDLVLEERLPAPWLLLAAAGSLLLLACANVANLQLAQLEARRQEFAIRLSLGARRGAVIRAVLQEHLALSALAGGLGLVLAWPFLRGLDAIRDVKIYEVPTPVSLSPAALLFALALVLATALAVGILPAYRASRADLAQVLKDLASTHVRGTRLQDGLVIVQVALALALIAGGALVARGLARARSTALGFREAGVAGLRLEFPQAWTEQRRADARQALEARIAALPGVKAVSWAERLPMEEGILTITSLPGKAYAQVQGIGPGYFATLGLTLLQGRDFARADQPEGGRIINQTLAHQLWPGQDPLGRDLKGHPVIGVVMDHGLSTEKSVHVPAIFSPLRPSGGRNHCACLLFRTEGEPEALFASAQQVLRAVDPDLPLLKLATLSSHLDGLHHHLRVASWLLGFCGLMALLMAAMGVQALLVFRIERQTREIGLRMALGAPRGRILREVIQRGMRSVGVGLALGALGAYALGRICHHAFKGVEPLEAPSLLEALGTLLGVSLLACLLPALRAAALDPARAMRQD